MDHLEQHSDMPERTLWLAVIERALKDYCFFFDRLDGLPQVTIKQLAKIDTIDHKSAMYRRTVGDLLRLRWFLFDLNPQPFNLSYLVRELYDDETIAEGMRTQAAQNFKRQLDKVRGQKRYAMLVRYIEENTGADKATPAENESRLRYKRYRLITDV